MAIDPRELAEALAFLAKQKPAKPAMDVTNVLFTNWTKEDFTYTWDKEPYTFKAGESRYLPAYLAEHFASHLTDREMVNKDSVLTPDQKKQFTNLVCEPTAQAREVMMAKCFTRDQDFKSEHPETASAEAFERTQVMAQNALGATSNVETHSWCDSCDSKGVNHKKDCPKNKPKAEVEFEGK